MILCKKSILGFLLLQLLCTFVQSSITGYIGDADKKKFARILSKTFQPEADDVISPYYGARGYQILKEPYDKVSATQVCNHLKAKFKQSDSLENVYAVLSTWGLLGCPGKLHDDSLLKVVTTALTAETSTVATIRYALEILTILKQKTPQPQQVAQTITTQLRKDDSLTEVGHALHAAALLGGSKGNGQFGVERAEEAVARADEFDGKLIQWEGGLSVTSLVLTGLLRLQGTGSQSHLTSAQAEKIANYLLTRRTVPLAKGVLALLEASQALADSSLSPVSITVVGPPIVTADRPQLRLRVGDILGRPLPAAAPVVAQSATRLADDVVVLAKQPLAPGTTQGEYTLPLKLEPGLYRLALNAANGVSTAFDVRVTGPLEVHWLEVGVMDSDGGAAPLRPSKLRYPSGKLQERLQADAGQRFVARLSLSRPVHQAFVRLAKVDDGREIIFVAELDSGTEKGEKVYKLEVNPAEELATSGVYNIEVIVGDSVVTNPVRWLIGQIEVNLGSAVAPASKKAPVPSVSAPRRGPKPEIQHQFRPKDRRPPALVSYIFAGLTAAPWLVLLVLWARLGAGIDGKRFRPTLALAFHLSLGAVLALYTLFWLKLDMFTTCGWLAPIGAATFLTGHRLLSRIAQDKAVKEKGEK